MKKKNIFEFAESPNVTNLKSQELKRLRGGEELSLWDKIKKVFQNEWDKVNERELKLGAAGMTALIYLIDKYGL